MVFPAKAAPLTGAQSGNRLLDRLPLGERDDVLARCDVVDLVDGSVLYEAGDPLKYAYFPVNGSISVIRSIDGHKPFETENIGREGMLGAHLILDLYRAPPPCIGADSVFCPAIEKQTGAAGAGSASCTATDSAALSFCRPRRTGAIGRLRTLS